MSSLPIVENAYRDFLAKEHEIFDPHMKYSDYEDWKENVKDAARNSFGGYTLSDFEAFFSEAQLQDCYAADMGPSQVVDEIKAEMRRVIGL